MRILIIKYHKSMEIEILVEEKIWYTATDLKRSNTEWSEIVNYLIPSLEDYLQQPIKILDETIEQSIVDGQAICCSICSYVLSNHPFEIAWEGRLGIDTIDGKTIISVSLSLISTLIKKEKNKMEVFELTWNFLREFFNYERYTNAIQKARNAIENKDNYQENWQKISTAIKERKFQPEEPLNLVNQAANQVLDENSDNEAYFWLDKLVYNLEILDDQIDEY